jgi:hypothetical protein
MNLEVRISRFALFFNKNKEQESEFMSRLVSEFTASRMGEMGRSSLTSEFIDGARFGKGFGA